MSRRARIAISALCALVVAVSCLLYAGGIREKAERERTESIRRYGGDVVTLVVANRLIEAGETVSPQDVSLVDWISTLAPEGALLSLDEVVGAEVRIPICANAPVCDLNFRNADQMAEIPAGHVAVSVPITDRTGITASVSVGSHVVAYRCAQGPAQLIARDAQVLFAPGSSSGSLGKGSLTIAVSAADVPALLEASTSDDLRLVLPAEDVRNRVASEKQGRDVEPVEGAQEKGSAAAVADGADTDEGRQQKADEKTGEGA